MSAIIYATSPLNYQHLTLEKAVPRVGELLVDIDIDFTEDVVELSESTGHVMVHDAYSSVVLFVNSKTS